MTNNSSVRKAGVGTTITAIAATAFIAAGVLAPATAAASPAPTNGSGSTTSQRLAPSTETDVQNRCLIWWRTSANYEGLTAGYSWAWNVVISQGATGDRVREIQCLLDHHDDYSGPLDGVFGTHTFAAVRWFQLQRGLDDDGIVGPATWRQLRSDG